MADQPRTLRITIPNTVDAQGAAADIVITLLRQEGMNPTKAATNPMVIEIVRQWTRRELSEAQVRHMLRNLLILNPNLRGTNP